MPRNGHHTSNLPAPLSSSWFCFPEFSTTVCCPRYHEGSEFCKPSPQFADLPTYFVLPSCRLASNHVMSLDHRFDRHSSVINDFQASPFRRGLARTFRRIEFVILQTDSSPPVAPHPVSRRRSYLRLRSCGILRHGLAPC